VLNLGKLCEVSGLNTVLVSVENWWKSYYVPFLLMCLLIRDLTEMEEVTFWKCNNILPHSVLLAYNQAERIPCILQSVGQLVQVKTQGLEC